MTSTLSKLFDYVTVCKPLIGLLAAVTGIAGYISYRIDLASALIVGAGLFFFSCAAGALNNCQDRKWDALHARTANRPLAQGRLLVSRVLLLGAGFAIFGSLVLWLATRSLSVLAVAWSCIVIYNGIYTTLKQKTSLAFVPGSICGFLCAYLGWIAAGGMVPTRAFILFLVIVVVWQFPHYFLISLMNRKDYTRSKAPSMFENHAVSSMEKWVVLWLLSYAGMTLLLYILGTVDSGIGALVLLLNGIALIVSSTLFLGRRTRQPMYPLLRNQLGISQLIILLLIISRAWF